LGARRFKGARERGIFTRRRRGSAGATPTSTPFV
jgi:hypothetical protein